MPEDCGFPCPAAVTLLDDEVGGSPRACEGDLINRQPVTMKCGRTEANQSHVIEDQMKHGPMTKVMG